MVVESASEDRAGAAGPTDHPSSPGKLSWVLASVATIVLAVVTAAAFPDRISFINDEPRQLAKAWYANAEHTLAPYGLQGNFKITYGPTATQIYQLILLVTHDPLSIAMIRAGLSAALTALGLLWLARGLRLNPWFAAAVSLAPFLWVFHRIIWDASWAIPIGTLGLAAYVGFMRSGRAPSLGLAIFCTLILPFIHPQDILLSAPIGLHMLWRHWRSLLRQWPAVVIPTAIVLVLNWQYIQHVRKEIREIRQGNTVVADQYPDGVVEAAPRLKSILAPFLSGRILSGYKYVDGGFASDAPGDVIIRAGKLGSHLIYPLIWIGTVVAVWQIMRRSGRGEPQSATSARRAIAFIALGSALFQMLVFGVKKIPIEPQYFFGTFVAHVLLAWFAVDWLTRYRLGGASIAVYGLSVAAITLGSIWLDSVRPLTGSPRAARPEILPLGMQVEGARSLNGWADAQVVTDVEFYQRFPHAMRSLRLLMPPASPAALHTSGRLVLTFGDGPDGPGTRLVVVDAGDASRSGDLLFVQRPFTLRGGFPWPRAAVLNVRPLPNGWLPGSDQ